MSKPPAYACYRVQLADGCWSSWMPVEQPCYYPYIMSLQMENCTKEQLAQFGKQFESDK